MSDSEKRRLSGETRDRAGQVEGGTKLPASGEAIPDAGGQDSSLATRVGEESHGFGSHLNEERKG